MKKLFLCLLLLVGLVTVPASSIHTRKTSGEDLNIAPVYQRTPVWCWLAVGEMVFEHYNIPNLNPYGEYQCGIVGALAGPMSPCFQDCRYCTVPAASLEGIRRMLITYPRIARQVTYTEVPQLRGTVAYSALTAATIKSELDHNRPIIAGINPSGFRVPGLSQHVALIVGYTEDEDDRLTLTVNDPFPYDLTMFSSPNPYDLADAENNGDGSYQITYTRFKQRLGWNTTIYGIRD